MRREPRPTRWLSRQEKKKVCNLITLLILYYISFGLVTLLKVNEAPIQVPDIL